MIGPGIPNPMLFAGGDPLDEFGKIERSVRLRKDASSRFSRVFAAPTNNKKFTVFGWVKKHGTLASLLDLALISSGDTSTIGISGTGAFGATYDNRLFVRNNSVQKDYWTPFFRDPSSHFHLSVRIDTDNATQADRAIAEVNGIVVAKGSSVLSLAEAMIINSTGATHYIGSIGALAGYFADVQFSMWGFVDGQSLPASTSGAFHPCTGQWRPKSKAAIRAAVAVGGGARNGWGANGALLPFDDTSSLTALGYDRSQSDTDTTGNNWTATNISLTAGTSYDALADTPTNNFATLNPLAWRNGAVQPTYSNGNLEVLNTSGVAEAYSLGTMPVPAGSETYFEATILAVSAATPIIGIADVKTLTSVFTNTFGYMVTGQKQINGVNTAYGAAFTTGDVIGVRVNTTVPEIEFYKQTGGAGAFVSQGVIALNAGVEYFPYVNTVLNSKAAFNFGQRAFNNSSPPTNAKMLCTKVRPVKPVGPMKSTSAFVAVKDSGANIVATLAAARSAFGSSYIDIIKRSDATAEGWRWIFSDDPTNYIDSSSTAAKAAVPAFGGTAYVGYSLKVSPANGVATGTFAHTNGANSVINDGLSNARKMIILLRESAGGGTRYVYHPDLTAGKLIYLNTTGAEVTDTSINTVTASGFTADAALPSGTYRWVSLAEQDGSIKLGKSVANANADGPFLYSPFAPVLCMMRQISSASNTFVFDRAMYPSNPVKNYLSLNSSGGEDGTVVERVDMVSNGTKVRAAAGQSPNDVNGQPWIHLMIAAFPFRYANAR